MPHESIHSVPKFIKHGTTVPKRSEANILIDGNTSPEWTHDSIVPHTSFSPHNPHDSGLNDSLWDVNPRNSVDFKFTS